MSHIHIILENHTKNIQNCYIHKDEDVVGTGCLLNMFRCENGPCIDEQKRCDGINDCPLDNSDELDCDTNSKSLEITPRSITSTFQNVEKKKYKIHTKLPK